MGLGVDFLGEGEGDLAFSGVGDGDFDVGVGDMGMVEAGFLKKELKCAESDGSDSSDSAKVSQPSPSPSLPYSPCLSLTVC